MFIYNNRPILRGIDERDPLRRMDRAEAWKKTLLEKVGRDHLSSEKGYVVAGCILDILDDIWDKSEANLFKLYEDERKTRYNVFVYSLVRYPPVTRETKKFLGK